MTHHAKAALELFEMLCASKTDNELCLRASLLCTLYPETIRRALSSPPAVVNDGRLREAAQAVVDRWDTPAWKDAEPTAAVINRLRKALGGGE